MNTGHRTGTPADALCDPPGCNFWNARPLAASHPGSTRSGLSHPTRVPAFNSGFPITPLEISLGGTS